MEDTTTAFYFSFILFCKNIIEQTIVPPRNIEDMMSKVYELVDSA
jgi:hypothetical protein